MDWRGRRILVTGHTGFKGGWLSLWLDQLGADVTGFAMPPITQPNLFDATQLVNRVTHIEGDVRDLAQVRAAIEACEPEVIFHLAAQPLVRLSYEQPVETYATNVMGTLHLLEAARQVGGVKAFIGITTDKCYENREWVWPYRETDPMGGADPYSSSKGCAELIISAYRRSFFPIDAIADGGMSLASVRAGNVIGGGDWAVDRLIPDLVRAFASNVAPEIRSPQSIRPWQHVLEALGGYLMIARRMLDGDPAMAGAWNFGPSEDDARAVSWVADKMRIAWGSKVGEAPFKGVHLHEAGLLKLDCSKARSMLGWKPAIPLATAVDWIVDWHQRFEAGESAVDLCIEQITAYQTILD